MRLFLPKAYYYDGEIWCGTCLVGMAPLAETPVLCTTTDEDDLCSTCGGEMLVVG